MVYINLMLEGGINFNRIYCVLFVFEINILKCEGK